jgi:hypothetical protein
VFSIALDNNSITESSVVSRCNIDIYNHFNGFTVTRSLLTAPVPMIIAGVLTFDSMRFLFRKRVAFDVSPIGPIPFNSADLFELRGVSSFP